MLTDMQQKNQPTDDRPTAANDNIPYVCRGRPAYVVLLIGSQDNYKCNKLATR